MSLDILDDYKFKFAEKMNEFKTLSTMIESIHTLNNKSLEYDLELAVAKVFEKHGVNLEKLRINTLTDYVIIQCRYLKRLVWNEWDNRLKTYDREELIHWGLRLNDDDGDDEYFADSKSFFSRADALFACLDNFEGKDVYYFNDEYKTLAKELRDYLPGSIVFKVDTLTGGFDIVENLKHLSHCIWYSPKEVKRILLRDGKIAYFLEYFTESS